MNGAQVEQQTLTVTLYDPSATSQPTATTAAQKPGEKPKPFTNLYVKNFPKPEFND
jgi:hypothetical protein